MIGCADLDEFSENFPNQKIMLQIFAIIFREYNDEQGGGHYYPKNFVADFSTS